MQKQYRCQQCGNQLHKPPVSKSDDRHEGTGLGHWVCSKCGGRKAYVTQKEEKKKGSG